MEESNNFIIKALAITLIAVLAINVYRTETTKKDISDLTQRNHQLELTLDSLISAPERTGHSYTNNKQFSQLEHRVAILETNLNAIKRESNKQATTNANVSSSTELATSVPSPIVKKQISVSVKAKLENRYVQHSLSSPKVSYGPEGKVVILVTVDHFGDVIKVSLKSESTILDEDIVDMCKECALKTKFSYNSDAPEKETGTITYTFIAK